MTVVRMSNFFTQLFLKENFLKIGVKVRVILGKWIGRGEVEERKRPNIPNIVAWRNYLATFYRQQLATLPS